jgi:streptogramin lyase
MIVVTLKRLLVTVFCLVLCVPVLAQTSTFTEWPIPTATSWPLHLVAGSGTVFYFTESARNTLAQLNTATNTFVEFRLPPGSMPHGVILNSNQLIFCAFNGNYLGFLNVTTGAFTGWPVPTKASGTIHLDLSTGGSVFFTEANGNKIGFLNPSTAQITEWLIPTAGALPRGVVVGQGSQVFVAELGVSKIAMLDSSANTITEWTLPSVFKQVEHVRFSSGQVYFGDLGSSWLGILDPVSNILTSWQSPSVNAAIPDVFVSSGSINFTERQSNKIGLLNPSQQAGMTQTLVPVTTPVPPVLTAVKSQLLHGTLVQTKVTPTSTPVTGVVTGGFTEWAIPTPGSQPLGIVQVGTSVAFTEYIGNNIGVLVPTQAAGKK